MIIKSCSGQRLALQLIPLLILGAFPAAADDLFIGEWSMTTRMGGGSMDASMTLSQTQDGVVQGTYSTRGMEMTLEKIVTEGDRITFDRKIPGGDVVHFDGTLKGGALDGIWTGSFGEAPVSGTRSGADLTEAQSTEADDEIPNLHDRPIVEKDGRRLLWAGEDEAGQVEWFDMTDSKIDPHRFQFGIGKDTIPSIDDPEFVSFEDPRLAARGVTLETQVLGVAIDGIARSYPVDVMSMHEVVNDRFGEKSFAVLW